MKLSKSRKCLCCKESFTPDVRNARHQKYCAAPACRKASHQASSRKWLAKPENKDYHRGPSEVRRVQEWQNDHPEYRVEQKDRRKKKAAALQDVLIAQVVDSKEENGIFPNGQEIRKAAASPALQDFITEHSPFMIGLLAHFFGFALQDDIANVVRKLQQLGDDITNGRHQNEHPKAGDLPGTDTLRAKTVQLDRSAAGAGSTS